VGIRVTTIGALLGCAAFAATPAAGQCLLCGEAQPTAAPPTTPLSIDVETTLDFSKVGLIAINQGGNVVIDPITGRRTISGALVDLGGLPVQGTVTVRGAPREKVRIDLPGNVTMTSADGGTLRLNDFQTSLKNNPRLGSDGTLRFTFGARLQVDGRSDGDFRGAIPIIVDYQ